MTVQAIEFAKDVETGLPVKTTIKEIISNRILWEGDSGSGKSHGMVGMIEGTDGHAQRIIIDPEGEYFPLKDNFQFLLIGQKTEQVTPNVILNTNDVYVDKLVKKLIEFSNDAIIDLSENAAEATHFLNIFQKAVFKYAKLMKRPLLIFVDEGQIFAPEKGQGNEESLKAMKELAKRGRKRGIGLICGTQDIADFSKDVVRQLRTRFIGNCTYDNDVKAAAHFLGFGKEREPELRELGEDHHFFVAGKAITVGGKRPKQVIKIKANANKTKLFDFNFDTKWKLKEKDAAAMKAMADNFSDIPQLIDQELNEKETLQKDNFEFKKQIQELKVKASQLERLQPRVDPKAIEKAYSDGYSKALKHSKLQFDSFTKKYQIYMRQSAVWLEQIITSSTKLKALTDNETIDVPKLNMDKIEISKSIPENYIKKVLPAKYSTPPVIIQQNPKQVVDSTIPAFDSEETNLTGPESRIIKALLSFPDGKASRIQTAFTAGYNSVTGGGFGNPLGHLRSLGLVEYNEKQLIATDAAKKMFPDVEALILDTQELHKFWFSKLPGPERRILTPIAAAYPNEISREETAQIAGYTSITGGGFGNPLGHLRSLGLIEYHGKNLKATAELFPEMLI